MQRYAWLPLTLALAIVALPRVAAAQDPAPGHPAPACPAGQTCPAPHGHEAMKARHEAMMQQHEEGAARLQELQDQMHAASGEGKVEAIEALLDEMLAQHRAMHAMMTDMHGPAGDHEGMKREADPDGGR